MPRRWEGMTALRRPPRCARPYAPRGLAVLAVGLLCALGLLAGGALRAGDVAHHRTHHTASVVTLDKGAPAGLRGEVDLMAADAAASEPALHAVGGGAERPTEPGLRTVDSVRTRGPPTAAR